MSCVHLNSRYKKYRASHSTYSLNKKKLKLRFKDSEFILIRCYLQLFNNCILYMLVGKKEYLKTSVY